MPGEQRVDERREGDGVDLTLIGFHGADAGWQAHFGLVDGDSAW